MRNKGHMTTVLRETGGAGGRGEGGGGGGGGGGEGVCEGP